MANRSSRQSAVGRAVAFAGIARACLPVAPVSQGNGVQDAAGVFSCPRAEGDCHIGSLFFLPEKVCPCVSLNPGRAGTALSLAF